MTEKEELIEMLNKLPPGSENVYNGLKTILETKYSFLKNRELTKTNFRLTYLGDLIKRAEDFKIEVLKYKDVYPIKMLESFFLYWAQPTADGKKMGFELQKTWSMKSRLNTWAGRNNNDYKKQ